MILTVDIKPLRAQDYQVAHRVFRDVRDWGHAVFIYPMIAENADVSLTVWYEDATGIQINYQSEFAEFITSMADLRKHLFSETLPRVRPRTPQKN